MQEVTGSIPVVSTTPRTVGCSRRFFSTFKIHLLYAAAILGIRISKFLVRALRPVRPSRFPVSKLPGAFRTLFLLFIRSRVQRTPRFFQNPLPQSLFRDIFFAFLKSGSPFWRISSHLRRNSCKKRKKGIESCKKSPQNIWDGKRSSISCF